MASPARPVTPRHAGKALSPRTRGAAVGDRGRGWQQLPELLLAKLNAAGPADWRRAAIDGSPRLAGLGVHRRLVEHNTALPHQFRRLHTGWEGAGSRNTRSARTAKQA